MRGVTYGSFAPRSDGALYPEPPRVAADFIAMAAAGLNTVRTYTVPPADVLEAAGAAGLRLIVGLHYKDWRYETVATRAATRRVAAAGERALDEALTVLAGSPTVLAVSVGNEIPSDVVRVHGPQAVSRVLNDLVEAVHEADSALLATYTNYPTTEYLELAGQDLLTFNVFLERPADLRAYLSHLQVLAGDRPLVVTELGLAADSNGEDAQAETLAWQLSAVDEAGCAGATVFSWTDEWHVGGHAVEGWGFGITDAERQPKPTLEVVSQWARSEIGELRAEWPIVSVVVCARNAATTILECLDSLERCDYPALDVIVCDDGSDDGTAELAAGFPFRLLSLRHVGLSAARNAGTLAARGEIVAFLDADAACHVDWPYHLALSLEEPSVGGTGGPNLPVNSAPFVERAVAASPGSAVEVLLSHNRAEHVPGCNMAFRKSVLEEIGGFDPVYRTAGDDVDVCWKLLDRGWQIAFAPAAQVSHHRRDTIRGYLRQQRGYGKAERLLAERHRHRFNGLGQARWSGFIYSRVGLLRTLLRPVIYHGYQGSAPFQKVVRRRSEAALDHTAALLPLLAPLALIGLLAPLTAWALAAPTIALLVALVYGGAVLADSRAPGGVHRPLAFRLLVAFLHVAQPFARAWGRASGPSGEVRMPEDQAPAWIGSRYAWLSDLARELATRRLRVRTATPTSGWDLEGCGWLARGRVTTAVVWDWQPLHRVVVQPRRTALLSLAAAPLAFLSPWLATAVAAGVLAGTALDAWRVKRLVDEAIAATTAERRDDEELSQHLHVRHPAIVIRTNVLKPEALSVSLTDHAIGSDGSAATRYPVSSNR